MAKKPKKKSSVFIKIGIVVLCLCVVVFALVFWFVIRPWPKLDGTLKIPGLQDKVTVMTDKWGTANIYAQNEHDLFMAQGFIHAQNRMWQMELFRGQATGTLSAIFGKRAIGSDIFYRSFGLKRIAERTWEKLDQEHRDILTAYCAGVNVYLDLHKNNLPIEYQILGAKPRTWTTIDSLSWGNLMGFILSGNASMEYLRSKIVTKIGQDLATQLFPNSAEGTPFIIPEMADLYKELAQNNLPAANFDQDSVLDGDEGLGSNDWTVHGSKTDSGKPMLANDMHLGLSLPSYWYQIGLHGGGYDVVGFSFPGAPAVIVGHNKYIAWGCSNLNPDTQDLYMEQLDDVKHPTKYKYKDQWFPLEVVHDSLDVKGQGKTPFEIYFTNHGPLMPSMMGQDTTATPLAMKWAVGDGNMLFAAITGVNRAENWSQFREALKLWDMPGQNFVYADVNGNIGYQATGKIPIRQNKNHNGLLTVPGWTGDYEWNGFIPFEALPASYNPPKGFMAAANNQVAPDDYPYILTLDWYPGWRAQRISDMLAASNTLTMDDMKNIQSQIYSIPGKIMCPYLITTVKPKNEREKAALQKIKDWDFYLNANSVAAGLYEVWHLNMIKNTVSDELGPELTDLYFGGNYQRHASQTATLLCNLLKDKDHVLWDDVNTPQKENREDIIQKSFQDALAYLTKRLGKDINKWQWGNIHTVTFKHTPLGSSGIRPVEWLFNYGPFPMYGDQFTVSEAGYHRNWPYDTNHGPSQRMILDLSDWDNSIWVNSSGQTENLGHPNRKDEIPLWYKHQYTQMNFSEASVKTSKRHELLLVP